MHGLCACVYARPGPLKLSKEGCLFSFVGGLWAVDSGMVVGVCMHQLCYGGGRSILFRSLRPVGSKVHLRLSVLVQPMCNGVVMFLC